MKRRDNLGRARISSKALSKRLPVFYLGGGSAALLIILSLIFIVTSALRPQLAEGVRMTVVDTIAPVLDVVTIPVQTAALFVRDVSGLAAMQSENSRLREENARLREWHQTALLLEAENKSLRELMNVKVDPQYKFVSANILSDTGQTFAKSLLVGAGRHDGVEKGQAVLSSGGVVGRVIEAGDRSSRVLLITDINSRVPVIIENSRLHAIFSGTNAEKGKLMHLPSGTDLKEGTRIMTSGRGGIFPVGMPVGVTVKTQEGAIAVEPYADFTRMMHVRILNKTEDLYLRQGRLD